MGTLGGSVAHAYDTPCLFSLAPLPVLVYPPFSLDRQGPWPACAASANPLLRCAMQCVPMPCLSLTLSCSLLRCRLLIPSPRLAVRCPLESKSLVSAFMEFYNKTLPAFVSSTSSPVPVLSDLPQPNSRPMSHSTTLLEHF